MKWGSRRWLQAHRYALVVWSHYPKCGPWFEHYAALPEAIARVPEGLYDWELHKVIDPRSQTGHVLLAFGVWDPAFGSEV